jgi:hypothetical protein
MQPPTLATAALVGMQAKGSISKQSQHRHQQIQQKQQQRRRSGYSAAATVMPAVA